jgi:cytochrome c5
MRYRSISALVLATSIVFAALTAMNVSGAAQAPAAPAQGAAVTTVWDGVFTPEQARRGEAAYGDSCGHCHDLGVEAPAIVGEAFLRVWFSDGLDVPFAKISETMPPDSAGSLTQAAYVDILSFLLEQSGFPSGGKELPPDRAELARILVTGKEGPGGPLPNFSPVAVVGCLTQDKDKSWMVIRASEPVRSRATGPSSPEALKEAASKPLGTLIYRFVQDFATPGTREKIAGHKVQAKGRLIRQPGGDGLNLSTLESLGTACGS